MKQFVVVTANEQDSLDVHVWFEEHETLTDAYKYNGLTADGEPGTGAEFCEYADEHEPGSETCEYCEEADSHRCTIVLEVPPIGKRRSASFSNG